MKGRGEGSLLILLCCIDGSTANPSGILGLDAGSPELILCNARCFDLDGYICCCGGI